MKVFLSWSGERSKAVAEALKSWLPQVIQSLEPWISSEIDKGRKWSTELATELETVPVGIICLTRDNLSKPWILFEAGALSKNANTWTFLFDVTGANVEQPLAQFQHTENEKEDIRKLVHSIAGAARNAGEKVPEVGVLNEIFETFWPKLEEKFKAVAPVRADAAANSVRTEREILEEILEVVRQAERRAGEPAARHLSSDEDRRGASRVVEVEYQGGDAPAATRFIGLLDNQPSVLWVEPSKTQLRVRAGFKDSLPQSTAESTIRGAATLAGLKLSRISF